MSATKSKYVPSTHSLVVRRITPRQFIELENLVRKISVPASIFVREDPDARAQGLRLAYVNYDSEKEALCSLAALRAWPPASTAMRKCDAELPSFSVLVCNVPSEFGTADVEALMAPYGPLAFFSSVVPKTSGEGGEFFVNFASFGSARTALHAGSARAVRLDGALLAVLPARNTTFVNALLAHLGNKRQPRFTQADMVEVMNGMPWSAWPPREGDLAQVCETARECFFRSTEDDGVFHVLAWELSTSAPPTAPRVGVEHLAPHELTAYRQRYTLLMELVNDTVDVLRALFETTWAQTMPPEASLCDFATEHNLPLTPLGDWDITTLCAALAVPVFRHKLAGAPVDVDGPALGSENEFDVLCHDGVVSEADLRERYLRMFAGAGVYVKCALSTVRELRNIFAHRRGSCPGLSAGAFAVLCRLLDEAMRTLSSTVDASHYATVRAFFDRAMHARNSAEWPADMLAPAPPALVPTAARSVDIATWTLPDVVAFFQAHGLPTEGVHAGQVDGGALLALLADPEAEALFCKPPPDGLGLNRLQYRGKLHAQLKRLRETV